MTMACCMERTITEDLTPGNRRPSPRFRVGGRGEEAASDVGDDRAVALALGALAQPFPVGGESAPLALALGHVVPLEHVVQIVVAVADHHGPEPDLTNAVPLPDAKRGFLESLVQSRQA